jgi:hypothetical protein
MVIAFLILASAAGMATSAQTSSIIYSTDFSSDPGWVTNNPYTNHWDSVKGMFHYTLRDSTNTFVYKKVPYMGESFRLEYDLYPLKTDFQSSFRLGLGSRDMYINQGTTIISEFENGPYGNITWLRVIDQANQRREVSSYSQSYGGPSVRFSDGTPYHVIMEYSRERKTAGISISFLSNGSTLWGYTLSGITNLGPLDRIYLSTIGDFENPSVAAEGDIDNVAMRIVFPSPTPKTPSATSPTTMITGGETGTITRTPSRTDTVPVTTPQDIPIPPIIVVSALALAAFLLLSSRK